MWRVPPTQHVARPTSRAEKETARRVRRKPSTLANDLIYRAKHSRNFRAESRGKYSRLLNVNTPTTSVLHRIRRAEPRKLNGLLKGNVCGVKEMTLDEKPAYFNPERSGQ